MHPQTLIDAILNVTYMDATVIPIKEDPLVMNGLNKMSFSWVIKNIIIANKTTNIFVKNPHII